MINSEKQNTEFIFLCLSVFALLSIIFGFIVNPAFVSKYLSPDGVIEKATMIKVYLLQILIITFGIVLFLYSLIKLSNAAFAGIIDEKLSTLFNKVDEELTLIVISLRLVKKDDRSLFKYIIMTWLIFLFLILISGLLDVFFLWKKADGYEYLWVAEKIERGCGFSLSMNILAQGCEESFPTALIEPVYPYLMALATKVFGIYGRPVILTLQVIALFFTAVFIYYLSVKVFDSPATGILAGSALHLLRGIGHLAAFEFIPVAFTGLMIVILTYMIFWCLDKPSVSRGIVLGLISGFTSLLYALTLTFIPIFVFAILISKNIYRSKALKTSFAFLFTAVIIISVWTTRNFLAFDHFVPVRTGFGYFFFESNPILTESFASQSSPGIEDSGILWKAKDERDAINQGRLNRNQGAMMKRVNEIFKDEAPEGYFRNAAKIDKLAFNKTLEFIFTQPHTFMTLTYYRIYDFLFSFGWKIGFVSLLSFISSILMLGNKKVRVIMLLLLAYASPYALVIPWFYRYRYPIDPLILILACYLPVLIFSKLCALKRKP